MKQNVSISFGCAKLGHTRANRLAFFHYRDQPIKAKVGKTNDHANHNDGGGDGGGGLDTLLGKVSREGEDEREALGQSAHAPPLQRRRSIRFSKGQFSGNLPQKFDAAIQH